MTQPEQNAAIGELVKTYSDAKQTRAAIIAELHKYGQMLKTLAYSLENVEHQHQKGGVWVPDNFPTASRLTSLMTDLQKTDDVIARTKKLLSDAGLPNISSKSALHQSRRLRLAGSRGMSMTWRKRLRILRAVLRDSWHEHTCACGTTWSCLCRSQWPDTDCAECAARAAQDLAELNEQFVLRQRRRLWG